MGTLTRGLLITAAATVLAAAPAHADDAAVWSAWGSHTPELKAADDDYTHAYDAAFGGHGSPTRKELKTLIAVNKRINSIMGAIRTEVDAAQPSTDAVAKAKKLTLAEIDLSLETNRVEVAAERQWLKGHQAKGHKLWVRSSRLFKKYARLREREKKAWVAAGYHPVGT